MAHDGDIDFGRWSVELDTVTAREQLLAQVQDVRASIAVPDESFERTRAVSRRFIIFTGPNQVVPVNAERVSLIPRKQRGPVEKVDHLQMFQPLLVEREPEDVLTGEEQSDARFTFFEACYRHRNVWRMLLSAEGLCPYKSSANIARLDQGGDTFYRVKQGKELADDPLYQRHFGDYINPSEKFGRFRDELTAIRLIGKILTDFEPELQNSAESTSC